jgi:hypothetical protein
MTQEIDALSGMTAREISSPEYTGILYYVREYARSKLRRLRLSLQVRHRVSYSVFLLDQTLT